MFALSITDHRVRSNNVVPSRQKGLVNMAAGFVKAVQVLKIAVPIVIDIGSALLNALDDMKLNSPTAQDLRCHMEITESLLSDGRFQVDKACKKHCDKLKVSFQECLKECKTIKKKCKAHGLLTASCDAKKLKKLDERMHRTIQLLVILHQKHTHTKLDEIREGQLDVLDRLFPEKVSCVHQEEVTTQVVTNQELCKPSKLVAEAIGYNMQISWEDCDNLEGSVTGYDLHLVEFASHKELLYQVKPYPRQCLLKPPAIKDGQWYSCRVRAVSDNGPGEWSERPFFKTSMKPSTPVIEAVTMTSLTTAEVSVSVPLVDTLPKGTQCVIAYNEVTKGTIILSLESTRILTRLDTKFYVPIKGLREETSYIFVAKLKNESNESDPSTLFEKKTSDLPLPGPPCNVRISTKHTTNLLKVRWDKPWMRFHSSFLDYYEVQMRKSSVSRYKEFHTISKVKGLSAKATNIRANTKYCFRIRAVYHGQQEGAFSDEVWGKTRHSFSPGNFVNTSLGIEGTAAVPGIGAGAGMTAIKASAEETGGEEKPEDSDDQRTERRSGHSSRKEQASSTCFNTRRKSRVAAIETAMGVGSKISPMLTGLVVTGTMIWIESELRYSPQSSEDES